METIDRDPAAAARRRYDLIIIGGGIYGAMLSLEAARRGLASLLLESDDFGARTSYNSLRILHGGFRYLQSVDLRRFYESVHERRWFLQTFPELVRILPCLMPLYGANFHSPAILRAALLANDLLSLRRNAGVPKDRCLPRGRVISPTVTEGIFPKVRREHLLGGAVWFDACMPDSHHLLMEVLRRAAAMGASMLNYMKVEKLLLVDNAVRGVAATENLEHSRSFEFRSRKVVNAAGPWCRNLAARFDRDLPELFRPSIAWNILFRRAPLSDHAVAVSPGGRGAQTYFLLPWKGRLLAGTGHAPASSQKKDPLPTGEQVGVFLRDLNRSIPGLEVCEDDILTVFSGYLPARNRERTQLAGREVIFDHQAGGGPRGFHTVSGVKFTTSRRVAEKTLRNLFPERADHFPSPWPRQPARDQTTRADPATLFSAADWRKKLRKLIAEEAVIHLDDLVFRRTNIGDDLPVVEKMAPFLCDLFGWDEGRRAAEVKRIDRRIQEKRADGYEHDDISVGT
jgi:glycerol-3-phosphate dehydrogenase